jgi:hypothetical protein
MNATVSITTTACSRRRSTNANIGSKQAKRLK